MRAASSGHTEVALALMATPSIDINYSNVSICILTPFRAVVGIG